MIAHITGKILDKTTKFLVVESGGLGYQIFASTSTLSNLGAVGSEISLWTFLAVRENALDLYGFETRDEKAFFELLIGVSGIGPKNALSILSLAPIEILKKAIGSGDISYLTKVSGIGKKTSEKIVVELRDKLASLGHNDDEGSLRGDADVLEALQSLGYSQYEIRNALKEVNPETTGTNEKIKEALKVLGK
ncbi:MAG: holliday junction helicase RuvA [Patescibacteria group bacterium]|jgi:Holliday junction DNA helicase RuvA|nr:holliday junction helicase RuvA [Patescibacteria group bacterium]MDQ5953116.1 holliday junction helicase RuvA [Patescibacteria group bacterium]